MFTSNILNNKCFRKMKHSRLWKNVILWAISRREISPLVVMFKKKFLNLHAGLLNLTTNIYLKSCAYLRLLLWEFELSEVLWRYTVILVCHLKHVEVGWSTRNYPHTCHLLLTCTLSRWRDTVFLHEVSIGRPIEDEKWTFFDISADFRAF